MPRSSNRTIFVPNRLTHNGAFGLSLVLLCALLPASANAQQANGGAPPAPKKDLTGIWEPVNTLAGIQPNGAWSMPDDGKPEHELHYTPYGLQVLSTHKTP